MAVHKDPTIDIEDYLTLDQNSKNARYEYLNGELSTAGRKYHPSSTVGFDNQAEKEVE